jgi:hypothetical protein
MAKATKNPEPKQGFYVYSLAHGGGRWWLGTINTRAILAQTMERARVYKTKSEALKSAAKQNARKWPGLTWKVFEYRGGHGGREINPHKSYSRLSAARIRKAGDLLRKSAALYKQADAAQKRGDQVTAKRLGKQALTLQRRFYASGAGVDAKWPGGTHTEGPVGTLPNPIESSKTRFAAGIKTPKRRERL